jgi:hypothetical protein
MTWFVSLALLIAFAGLADADSGPGREALALLQGLRTMTTGQPTHAEYMGRVAYAKSRIDILLTKVTDKALASAISTTVRFYYLAADMWTEMLQGKGSHVSSRERADDVRAVIQKSSDDCAALSRLRSASDDELVAGALPAAWSCAEEKLNEVERLLTAR